MENKDEVKKKPKTIRFGISMTWDVPIDDDYLDRIMDPCQLTELLSNYFDKNNMTAETELFDNVNVLCNDCGISLQQDDEYMDLRCSQCQAIRDENDPDLKIE